MSQFKGASKFPTKQGGGKTAPKTVPATTESNSGSKQGDLCSAAGSLYRGAVKSSETRKGDQALRTR